MPTAGHVNKMAWFPVYLEPSVIIPDAFLENTHSMSITDVEICIQFSIFWCNDFIGCYLTTILNIRITQVEYSWYLNIVSSPVEQVRKRNLQKPGAVRLSTQGEVFIP